METRYYLSLRTRFAIVLIFLAALFAAGVSYVLYQNFRKELRNDLRHRLENITTLAGLQQNGDQFELVNEENDQYFQKIQRVNFKIKTSDPDLIYVYTMRKDAQGIYFVVDAGPADEEGYSPYGTRYLEPGPALSQSFENMTGTVLENDIYSDEYGSFLSGYTPILNSKGEKVGVLGVDISATTIRAQERSYLSRLIIIYIIVLPFIVFAGILTAHYLATPIIQIRDAVNRISKGELSHRITKIPNTRELADLAVDFNAMTASLSDLIGDLERRVIERTEDTSRKTEQLRAAAYIARQTAEVQDLHVLLNMAVNLITDQFYFYHSGVFLINEAGDELTLRSASSDGGKRMLARGHSLKVGTHSIVGYVAWQKKTRIALDVGTDPVFFNNPDLPLTRSEIALPLLTRGKLLGVLDIQSAKPVAFTVEDMSILETLADQVAVAIENAKLLSESQEVMLQLEAITAVRTREVWEQKLTDREHAVTYTPLGLRAEKVSPTDDNALIVPITLRGQKIGSISIARKGDDTWSRQDEEMIAEVAVQAGLAVDNIRLLEDATQKAKQEQIVGGLAYRFSQAIDFDSLLQNAARELGQLPGVEEVSVFLGENPEGLRERNTSKRA